MADVIRLDPHRRKAAPPEPGEACGRILLFTGVRYERMAETPTPPRRPGRTPRSPRRAKSS